MTETQSGLLEAALELEALEPKELGYWSPLPPESLIFPAALSTDSE